MEPMEEKHNLNYLIKIIPQLLAVASFTLSILIFQNTRTLKDDRFTEMQKIAYERKLDACSNVSVEFVKLLRLYTNYVNLDSVGMHEKVGKQYEVFFDTAIEGCPVLSDSLIGAIGNFNNTFQIAFDSVEHWRFDNPDSSTEFSIKKYLNSPISKRFKVTVDSLFFSVRKETGVKEISSQTLKDLTTEGIANEYIVKRHDRDTRTY